MFHYNAIQWLFIFYTYSFLGWCFESTYVSIKSRKVINRGFMRGPFLPLYGSGAVMMLVVSMPFSHNFVLTYIAGCIGATVLEYITGVTMEALFKVRYWDYSYKRFNFQGQICLSSTIAWGFFTVLMTRVLHPPMDHFVLSIPQQILGYVTALLTVYIVIDFTLSFKAAMDLQDILAKIQEIREEMEGMERRLDVLIAFNNEEREQKKQERTQSLAELSAELRQRFEGLKESIMSRPSEYGAAVREEIAELRGRFSNYRDSQNNYSEMLDFYKRDMIRNNPTMVSVKFKDALEELKKMAGTKKK